jgi:hypothetical protein
MRMVLLRYVCLYLGLCLYVSVSMSVCMYLCIYIHIYVFYNCTGFQSKFHLALLDMDVGMGTTGCLEGVTSRCVCVCVCVCV